MRKNTVLLVVLLCGLATRSAAAQTITPVELSINDSFSGNLHSDGKSSLPGIYGDSYVDNRVAGGDICVNALLSSGTVGKVRVNMDFNPNVSGDCDVFEFGSDAAGRSYGLTFQSNAICKALGFTGQFTCAVMAVGRPSLIQADTLFGTGATTSSVEFQFGYNGNSYQLRTDNPATISGTGATRTAMYNGTATLSPLSAGGTPIGSTNFPFQFAVTKCTTSGCP